VCHSSQLLYYHFFFLPLLFFTFFSPLRSVFREIIKYEELLQGSSGKVCRDLSIKTVKITAKQNTISGSKTWIVIKIFKYWSLKIKFLRPY
jgi:hypothetical protein